MVTLYQQVKLFYKLATGEELPPSLEEYKKDIVALPVLYLQTVLDLIVTYENTSFFDLKDFLPALYRCFCKLGWDPSILHYMVEALPQYEDFIVQYILRQWATDKNEEARIDAHDYVGTFDKEAPEDVQRMAKVKVINFIASLKDGPHDDSLAAALYTLSKARSFSKSFIENLAKHFGIDIYNEYRHKAEKQSITDGSIYTQILEKQVINIYDIALLFNSYPFMFNPSMFKTILNAAVPRAKEYARGFIYTDKGHVPIFILDDTCQPINLEYKNIDWPERFVPTSLVYIRPTETQEQWRQLFHDFNIIPQ